MFDYSQEIIKDNLVRGIADQEILADLLGDPKTDRSLEEMVSFISQKEQGKATRAAVGDCAAPISTLRNGSRNDNSNTRPQSKCWACGGPSHGPKMTRSQEKRNAPPGK